MRVIAGILEGKIHLVIQVKQGRSEKNSIIKYGVTLNCDTQ